MNTCIFWTCSQSEIDNAMKCFKEYVPRYNWEQSKGESVCEFLCIYINTLDDGGFKCYQTGSIQKVLEDTGMEHFNGLPTLTKAEAPLEIDVNGSEVDRDWNNSYDSVLGIMLYLASNTRPYISF